jgi:broad specificity phosphatase PhoE
MVDFDNTIIGKKDQPLSYFGIHQANELIERFKEVIIRRILVTDYIWTYQTIGRASINKFNDPIRSSQLNEIDSGLHSRCSRHDQSQGYPGK